MALIKDKAKYIDAAHAAEEKYGIPRNTLVGLLGAESNFNPNAVSSAGARGIAQFMKATAQEYGINPLDPFQSIDAAGKYLASSYKKFGNWEDSLRSYNLGVGGVQQWKAGKRTLPKETQEYVGRVYKKAGINYAEPNYANSVQPYMTQQNSNGVINLSIPTENTNLASVPEQSKEVETAKEEIQQKETQLNEQNFINELFANNEEIEQEEVIPQAKVPQQNILEKYAQIESFVDTPITQTAQQGGIIKDNNGQWAHPGEITQISSPNITMKNVNYPVLGVADTGEKRMMYPNQEYHFSNAKTVTEYPQLTDKEKAFLKELQRY